MSAPWWFCWPTVRTAAKHAIRHRPARHVHHARRVITWTCVVVGGTGAAIVPPLFLVPSATPHEVEQAGIAPLAYWPPEAFGEQPPEFFTLPPAAPQQFEIIGPPVLLPDLPAVPESPSGLGSRPVPEPSSLVLLAAAVLVGVTAWRGRGNG